MNDILGAGRSVYMETFVGGRTNIERYISGEKSLLYIIIELAVTDCKALIKEGIIVNGKCVKKWPSENGMPKKFLHDYNRIEDVVELLGFMSNNGMSILLTALGNKLDADKVNRHLGLVSKRK